jgi:hypothetical protein
MGILQAKNVGGIDMETWFFLSRGKLGVYMENNWLLHNAKKAPDWYAILIFWLA